MPNTTLINNNNTIVTLHIQLPNNIVLKSTHEGNIKLAALPKEETKAHAFPYITSGA